MIPMRHTLTRLGQPWVTRGLVYGNALIFTAQLLIGRRAEALIQALGFIPARLVDPGRFHSSLAEAMLTLLTSLFLHGGFVHLIGNMIYLHVFGNAVEGELGHTRFFLFYVAGGVMGSLAHTCLFPHSTIPSIGASGSIAAILGAFLVLHPKARIVTLFPLVVYWAMAEVPALLLLPVWFAMQFLNGFLMLAAARGTEEVAGIAWWAHIGGFLFGAIVGAFARRRGVQLTNRVTVDSAT
jgi:membrane associated rhomboid family serine protease